jgi:hypothetical protein
MKKFSYIVAISFAFAAPVFADVVVSSPSNGETVSSPVPFVATATTSTCSRGVASIGVYVDNQLTYVVNGTSLNTTLPVGPGNHNTVIEEWDYCGGATFTSRTISVSGQSGVFVTSPANNSTVSSPTNYVATATTGCSKGVASMGVYVNNQLAYVTQGAKLNTQLNLATGTQHTVVEEWDNCGGASYTPVAVTIVGGGSASNPPSGGNASNQTSGGNVLSNLQASGGWNSWGELAPVYAICTGCPGVSWSMAQHITSPSLSGNATQFNIGGSTPYSDVLWSNPVIGQNTTQNIPDSNHTLLPNLHNFTYSTDFYVTNASITQVLEFDINMYMNGLGMTWGTQCNFLGGNDWNVFDNVNVKWVPTGIACNLKNGWNHLTLQVQRESDNSLLYQSVTLNGVTSNINKTFPPFSVPGGWWGITVNYQMDGNYKQSANTTYLDNFSLTYW